MAELHSYNEKTDFTKDSSRKRSGMVVIGAGLPRTGTLSLRVALSKLLHGRCYHGMEFIVGGKEHLNFWESMYTNADGVPAEEIKRFFEGKDYIAGVDFPFALYWRQVLKTYPDAKVVLTVRDSASWHKSVMTTLYPDYVNSFKLYKKLYTWFVGIGNMDSANACLVAPIGDQKEGVFGACKEGPDKADEFFQAWVSEVKKVVPEEQLLIFSVKEGWEPLCKFLDAPVPDEPFPRLNDSKSINEMIEAFDHKARMTILYPTLLGAAGIFTYWLMKNTALLDTVTTVQKLYLQ